MLLLPGTAGCGGASKGTAAPPSTVSLRVLTWNIHHGEGIDGRLDLDRIAALIRDNEPDVVALQEVDRGAQRTQGRDIAAELGALTGMTPVFERNIQLQGGEYGNATLSRWPVLSVTNHHYRMFGAGEQRGLLKTVIDVRGHTLEFWNTHLDHRSDDAERRSSVVDLRQHLAAAQSPVIVVGDFNAVPESAVYQGMTEAFIDAWAEGGTGDAATFPGSDSSRRIDYVWLAAGKGLSARKVQVLQSDASDHWAVVADLVLER